MSELLPAAQAVLAAYKAASDGYYSDSGEWIQDHKGQIAAALRAVADQGEIFFDAYDSPVQVVTVDDLLAIAHELEAK